MMVADDKSVSFNLRPDSEAGIVMSALPGVDRESLPQEHDAKALIIAVAMCLGCWLVLGYFLLG